MIGHLGAVKILAAAEVVSDPQSPDYVVRSIMRAYSERFSTPLHVVETLPLHDVLQHHYEALYADAAANDDPAAVEAWHQELERLSLDDYGLRALIERKAREAAEDAEFHRAAEAEAKRQPAPAPPPMPKPLAQRVFGADEPVPVVDMKFATDEQLMAWESDPGVKPI